MQCYGMPFCYVVLLGAHGGSILEQVVRVPFVLGIVYFDFAPAIKA